MNLKKRCTTVLMLLLSVAGNKLSAQTFEAPKITPASPTAQTFMRYGEIPLDFSTGVPNIDIPIYTLKGNQLKIPISISYHASGIKVNDIASEVGLGWALNCGGLVSRTVNGLRDENSIPATYNNATNLLNALITAADQGYNMASGCMDGIRNFEHYLTQVFDVTQDPMKDRYFYKLPTGASGVFTYDYVDANKLITLPYSPILVSKTLETVSGQIRIKEFKITDENGTVYTFQSYMTNTFFNNSEWVIKEMQSADGKDKITFNYIIQTNVSSSTIASNTYAGWAQVITTNCGTSNTASSLASPVSILPQFTTPVIQSIESSNEVVNFEYGSRNDFNNLKRLINITIAPKLQPSVVVKRITFEPLYFGSNSENFRLGLNRVIIDKPGSSSEEEYAFTYESQALPSYQFKTYYPTYSEDYWGYYNGNINNSLIPRDFISNTYDAQAYGATRDADVSSDQYLAKACMLKEIRYPTGGRTVFNFGRFHTDNLYSYMPSGNYRGGYLGGFRIESIINYSDDNRIAFVKTFKYELPVYRQIRHDYYSYNQTFLEKIQDPTYGTFCYSRYSREMISSNPLLPCDVAPGMPIMYQKVTEYNGTLLEHAGKTEYIYEPPYSPCDFLNNLDHPVDFESPLYYHPYHYDRGNYVPKLERRKIFLFDGTDYHVVSEERNTYNALFTQVSTTGIKMTRTFNFPSIDHWCYNCPFGPTLCAGIASELIQEYKNSVVAIDTKAYQEANLLTNSKMYTYNPNNEADFIMISTDYEYNEHNIALKSKTFNSSKEEPIKTSYEYPYDFASQQPYSDMVSVYHVLSPVIDETVSKSGSFLYSTKTNFDFWGGSSWSSTPTNIILPRSIETKKQNNAPNLRLRYNMYDVNDNVLSVSKESDVNEIFLWGYNSQYPIARIVNAEFADVAATSFETEDGNWYWNGSIIPDATAPTGKLVYNMNTGYVSKTGLSATRPYIVSYWTKNATAFSIGGTQGTPTSGPEINGWRYFEHKIIGQGSITLSGTGLLDELRLYPEAALTTTYTYDPLIGMTSQTDTNGNTTYYEYDDFNRLKHIKDKYGNIIKKFCYNYSGQTISCD